MTLPSDIVVNGAVKVGAVVVVCMVAKDSIEKVIGSRGDIVG
jgi:hypothetical protein